MTDKKTPDDINPIPRRSFLVGAGTAVAASLTPAEPAQAQQRQARGRPGGGGGERAGGLSHAHGAGGGVPLRRRRCVHSRR